MSLACWPAIVYTQNALDLVSLTFSPGPVSDGGVLEAVTVDDVAWLPDSSAPSGIGSLIEAVRAAEEDISAEETRNGPNSPALIEHLQSIAELHRALGDHALAIAALERARLITRVHDGLHTLSQIQFMEAMVDLMEEAGAYYESESLQDEILVLASRNDGDARVPSILVAVADRQMDAVTQFLTAGRWDRSLERIHSMEGSGWDLENIEFLRYFSGKKPLKRLDGAIRETLTNGTYEIGDTLDARDALIETYAMIDVVNDHNEAGQSRRDEGGVIFESNYLQRDLALSAFRRARRLYSSALQTMLESGAQGSGEYLAVEGRMIETYHFELQNAELYPTTARRRMGAAWAQEQLRPVVYGTGTSVLEARVVNLLSHRASAVEIAAALMAVGDWHLLFSANGRAMDLYRDAYDLLVREGVPSATLTGLVSPPVPAILAELTTDESLPFDPAHAYSGHVDVAVETGRFGEVKKADIDNSSAGTSADVEQRARTHVFETRFRPRYEDGEPRRSDRFTLRYYYDYREWEEDAR